LPLDAVRPDLGPGRDPLPFFTVMLLPREVAVDGLLVAAVVEDDVVVEVGDGRAPVEVAAHACWTLSTRPSSAAKDGHADPDLAEAPMIESIPVWPS
jgi:hypothetical protein